MRILSQYRLVKSEMVTAMKKFDTKAPFYSTQQKEKFVTEMMRKVFKYPREEYTKENFMRIWKALDTSGLSFITSPKFGGNRKDMNPDYKKDYIAVLKRYFGVEWLAPFDGSGFTKKIAILESYVEQAIEMAGLDPDYIVNNNGQKIYSVAVALSQVLRDIQVLNSFQEFDRFLIRNHGTLSWNGVTDDDMEAISSEILRCARVYLWKGQPDNEYTYYR